MSILIIGKGRRVKETILPAIRKIQFKDIYLYSKNSKDCQKFCNDNNLIFLEHLNKIPKNIETVFIAIPTSSLYEVSKRLNLNLFQSVYIDTPLIGPIKNLSLLKYKNNKIFVTEDWISKPFFLEVKNFLKKNIKEKISEIFFINSGFTYHALAACRYLIDDKFFNYTYCKRKNNNFFIYFNKVKINIINPRDYLNCNTYIITSNYILVDDQYSNNFTDNEINNKKILFFVRDEAKNKYYFTNTRSNILISNDYENNDKIFSITQKLMLKEKKYYLLDGIYDSLVFTLLNKFSFFVDVGIYRITMIKIIIKWLKYIK